MTRIKRSGGAICAVVVAVLLLAVGGQAVAVDVPVRWDGEAGTCYWTDSENWDPYTEGGPANIGALDFLVTIGCPGTYDPVCFDVFSPVEITDFFLCDNSRLLLEADTDLTVLRTADIAGILDGQGGDFTAVGNAVFTGGRTRLYASGGSVITICAPTYCSTGLWSDNGHSSVATYDWTLMQATGIGTLLDLSCVTNIDAGFNSSGNDNDLQRINAFEGGAIDLSGVESVLAPNDGNDRIEFNVENGGSIDLSSLVETQTLAKGYTQFAVTNAVLGLPSVAGFDCVQFLVDGEAIVEASGAPATYSSQCFWSDNGYSSVATYDWTLMQATGIGTLLDLSCVTNIDAGFNSSGNDNDLQKINAFEGGAIDLSGVESVLAPNDGNDRVEFNATGGAIDLSALQLISSAESGELYVDIACGGHVLMGDVSITDCATTMELDTASLLSLGGLQADSPVAITLNDASDRLEVAGSLLLGDTATITAQEGGTISIGGDFLYEHEDKANLNLDFARLECVGDWQQMEVGGVDYDLEWHLHGEHNFGYQQLTIGEPGHATRVELVDLYDNLQSGVADSLLLWGIEDVAGEGGLEGLRILSRSTLVINDLNVYARLDLNEDGVMEKTRIRELFPKGETVIRFNHNGNDGFIATEDFAYDYVHWSACMTGPDDGPYGPGCAVFDSDLDGDVDMADFAEFSIALADGVGGCFIETSTPSDGWIDARQPLDDVVNQNPAGWDSVEIKFHHGCDASVISADDFTISEVCEAGECDGVAPEIESFVGFDQTGTLTLDRPIDPKAWTVITYHGSDGDEVIRLGYLPADADASGTAAANDIIEVVEAVGDCAPLHQFDIDRSGSITAADITVLIDLLNGASPFESYWYKCLPPLP